MILNLNSLRMHSVEEFEQLEGEWARKLVRTPLFSRTINHAQLAWQGESTRLNKLAWKLITIFSGFYVLFMRTDFCPLNAPTVYYILRVLLNLPVEGDALECWFWISMQVRVSGGEHKRTRQLSNRERKTEGKGQIALGMRVTMSSTLVLRRNTKADERKALSILSSRSSLSFRGGKRTLQ
jgi:hypothetical protein